MFCKHKWRKLSETTTKSQAQQLAELGASKMSGALSLLARQHIVILACDECGATKKFVTEV